jgi:hypothetical protein
MNQILQKQEQKKLKEEKLMKFFKHTEQMNLKKSKDFQKRQEKLENNKKIREYELKQIMQEKAFIHLNREEQLQKQRNQIDIFREQYDNKLQEKIAKINDRILYRKENNNKELIDKYDKMELRREDNFEKYQNNIKANEYEREKRLDCILQRIKKIEEFKYINILFNYFYINLYFIQLCIKLCIKSFFYLLIS